MTAKIVEVVAEILEGINNKYSFEELNQKLLTSKKFDQQTVSAAFSLIYDKVLDNRVIKNSGKNNSSRTFRFLTEQESEVIGLENYNYLLHLYNVGLLDVVDFEMILEQIMMFPEDTVTRDDINWTIFVALLDINAELLPGSRLLLYSSDTIN
jgi:uncharacterized protein Smg (DUF494 family)